MYMWFSIMAVVTPTFIRAGHVFLKAHAVTLLTLRLLALAVGVVNFLLKHLLFLLQVRVTRKVLTVTTLTGI